MIYFVTTDGQRVLIVEPANIEKLKRGEPMHSPDKQVLVCFTPDMQWFQRRFEMLIEKHELDAESLDALLKDEAKRQEVHRDPPPPRKRFDIREN